MRSSKKSNALRSNFFLLLLFIFLIFVGYHNSFQASWQLDDTPNILKNHRIQLKHFSLPDLWKTAFAQPGSGGFYRPVACMSLAINWYFGQDNVFGYHIVNFMVHCVSAWLLFLTIRLLFSTPRLLGLYSSKQIQFIAVVAGLLWALNPVHVQAVTYIVQRMSSMAAMFSLFAIFFYLKARLSQVSNQKIAFLTGSVISYLLALFCKENAAMIILSLPVLEVCFFHSTLSRPVIYKIAGGIAIGCCILLIAWLLLGSELFDFILQGYNKRSFTLIERFLTEQRIVLYYLSQLFFPAPSRLSIEHDIILSTSLFSPWTTIAALTVNLLFMLLAVKFVKKQPLFSLSILFFFLNHLVESTIIPLELVFEHRNYLPSLFLFLPVAQAVNFILSKVEDKKLLTASIVGGMAFLLAAEGYATYLRNQAWQTEKSLWLDAVAKAPNSSRPLAILAIKLAWGPNSNEIKLRKALELTKQTLSMRMHRIQMHAAQLGNIAGIYNKLGEYHEADKYYEQALEIVPEDATNRYNFCINLIMSGNFIRAREEMKILLDKEFVHADYYNMLGFIDLWTGQPERALPFIRQALSSAPFRPDILLTLGKCLSSLGYYDKAHWYFSLAKQKGRNEPIASLCIIENALRANLRSRAHDELKYSIERFSLANFFRPLHAPPHERYREVPLASGILIPYIQFELPKIIEESLPQKR
jgi:protein O-mannosyl-transferase